MAPRPRGAPTAPGPEALGLCGEPGAGGGLRAPPARCPAGRNGEAAWDPHDRPQVGSRERTYGGWEASGGPTGPGELCHHTPTCCVTDYSPGKGRAFVGGCLRPRLAAPLPMLKQKGHFGKVLGARVGHLRDILRRVCVSGWGGRGREGKAECVQICVGAIWRRSCKARLRSLSCQPHHHPTSIPHPPPKEKANLISSTSLLPNLLGSCDCSSAAAGNVYLISGTFGG